jgi:hypothetical protein
MSDWQKPSVYSVAVIVAVLAFVGFLSFTGKLSIPEGVIGALLGVITWVTNGARPPIVDKIGASK